MWPDPRIISGGVWASQRSCPRPPRYRALLAWAKDLGEIETFDLKGTGSYGAGLARYLRSEGHDVVEVIGPNRQGQRRIGKSDPADADAAASTVLSGDRRRRPESRRR